jgi:hypothetical protein
VLPILESAGTTITANGFQRYHDHLHNSLGGRTPALDSILSPLEARARRIRMDVERMRHDEPGIQYVGQNETFRFELMSEPPGPSSTIYCRFTNQNRPSLVPGSSPLYLQEWTATLKGLQVIAAGLLP